MAQLVARFHGMEEATGSNPVSSTTTILALTRPDKPSRGIFVFRRAVSVLLRVRAVTLNHRSSNPYEEVRSLCEHAHWPVS